MQDNLDLMQIQVETLFRHDEAGHLTTVNEPGGSGDAAPRFFMGCADCGTVRRYRQDLPEEIAETLKCMAVGDRLLADPSARSRYTDPYRKVLEEHAPVTRIWVGPAYSLMSARSPAHQIVRITTDNIELAGEIDSDLDACQPCVAVVEGGRAVALCQSVRIGPRAHEAGVDTMVAYRRRGYATAATLGWAAAVLDLGAIPLYSTSWDNVASQGVARKLGAIQYGVDLHFT